MIWARRFDWRANPLENTAILDAFVARPEYMAYRVGPDVARASFAASLADPQNIIWTTYSDDNLTGVVLLTHIVPPRVNALLHFLFIDHELVSKRNLLRGIITHCFRDLDFHRLSMEVPEGVRLERFARKVLGFRLEGESRPRNPELPSSLTTDWVARQGSRREKAYYNGTEWSDIILLRLLASEHATGRDEASPLGHRRGHRATSGSQEIVFSSGGASGATLTIRASVGKRPQPVASRPDGVGAHFFR